MRTVGTGIGLSLVISTHWDMAVTSLFLSIWPSIAAIWQFNLPVAAQSSWLAGKAITENASSQSHQQSMTEGWSVKAETQAEKNRIVWEKVNWNIGKRREAGKYEKIRLEVLEPEGVTRCQTPPHPPPTHRIQNIHSKYSKIQPVASKYTGTPKCTSWVWISESDESHDCARKIED